MGFRSQFKRSVLFWVSVQVSMGLLPLSTAHAGAKEWCEFFLGQRSSPRLSRIEKWQNEAARDRKWRPPAARYYEGVTEPYKAATDPRYWYLPGNVAYDDVYVYFPKFIREYQEALRGQTLPRADLLVAFRTHGPDYVDPLARRSRVPEYRRPESVRGREEARRRDDARRRDEDEQRRRRRNDDDSSTSSSVVWDNSPSTSARNADSDFAGRGGSSGGAGASGEWNSDPSPAHAPSHSHSHSQSSSHSHSSHDSGSSSSSSGSSGSDGGGGGSDGGGGGGGGGGE